LFAHGAFTRKGGWYYHTKFPEGKIQGRDSVIEFLKENPVILTGLISKLDTELTIETEEDYDHGVATTSQ